MMKMVLSILVVAIFLIGIAACGSPQDQDRTKTTSPSTAPTRTMLGPIDLAAETVDLVANFPKASIVVYAERTIVVDFGRVGEPDYRPVAAFRVAEQGRILEIEWSSQSTLETPDGFATNMPMTELAKKYTDLTCVDVKLDHPDPLAYCSSPSTGGFHYLPNDGIGHPTPVTIANLTPGATIHSIRWVARKGGGPRVLNVASMKRPD
jgi:hypothetical protein